MVVTNRGPSVATGVSLVDTLPKNSTFISLASADTGNCGQSGGILRCNIASLSVNQTATYTVQVAPNYSDSPRNISNAAVVTGVEVDPNLTNNVSISASTTVMAPSVAQLKVSGLGKITPAGVAVPVTVTAQDQLGTTVTGYRGTVVFSSSDSSTTVNGSYLYSGFSYQFQPSDNGAHTFTIVFASPFCGEVGGPLPSTLTATDSAASSSGTASTTVYGSVSRFDLTATPDPATAGSPMNVNVKASDFCGNVVPDYCGTIHFSPSDSSDTGAVVPSDYTFTAADAGVHNFSATLTKVSQFSSAGILVTDLIDYYAQGFLYVNLQPGPAAHFSVSVTAPPTGGPGVVDVTVSAVDAYGNPTAYNSTVYFSSTDPLANLPPPTQITSGSITLTGGVTFNTHGVFTTLIAYDPVFGISGSQTVFVP